LYERIEWQNVPDVMAREDLTGIIADAIRDLYVMTGRALQFSESLFVKDDDLYLSLTEDLLLDEQEYVLVTAEIKFYQKVQTSVNQLTSYTTDAMALTHGDKPFANLQQTINDAKTKQKMYWFKMSRYHLPTVKGV
jgi:hypothetical protein